MPGAYGADIYSLPVLEARPPGSGVRGAGSPEASLLGLQTRPSSVLSRGFVSRYFWGLLSECFLL